MQRDEMNDVNARLGWA